MSNNLNLRIKENLLPEIGRNGLDIALTEANWTKNAGRRLVQGVSLELQHASLGSQEPSVLWWIAVSFRQLRSPSKKYKNDILRRAKQKKARLLPIVKHIDKLLTTTGRIDSQNIACQPGKSRIVTNELLNLQIKQEHKFIVMQYLI